MENKQTNINAFQVNSEVKKKCIFSETQTVLKCKTNNY